ncbi:hypothetical protein [Sphingomonas echinoides]|uniref:hypothetical protein n=1 Tax=Sphingomonas echinoides TaxID=59803 RepID=UPI0024136095|nr:hypothetical protein [Sphingomonas echinoides]
MPITLTDHERAFAGSPEGLRDIAAARRLHETREAHKGVNARQWNDAMQANAVRNLTTANARARVMADASAASSAAQLEVARAVHAATTIVRKDKMRSAWKGR